MATALCCLHRCTLQVSCAQPGHVCLVESTGTHTGHLCHFFSYSVYYLLYKQSTSSGRQTFMPDVLRSSLPLLPYLADYCVNNCRYCAFRAPNKALPVSQ